MDSTAPPNAALFQHAPDRQPPTRAGSSDQSVEISPQPGLQHRLDMRWLRDRVGQAVRAIETTSLVRFGRVGIFIIDDARMVELNRRHLGLDHTTDVLSFNLSECDGPINAELALNADEAARRSAELGHSLERELLLYALHGLLHCAGFDDADEAGSAAMHEREDMILTRIGVGATFNGSKERAP